MSTPEFCDTYEASMRVDMAEGVATVGEVAEHYDCSWAMAKRLLKNAKPS